MKLLVTAGPTREFFDSVRFISNPSSGKMGYAIAAEAARRGHGVVLVSGPVDLPDPPGVRVERVVSADEMFEASVAAFDECDAAVMTAAVCDYRPSRRLPHKLQKRNQPRQILLQPTRDICAHLGSIKGDRVVVGFAMEDHDAHAHAESKLKRKNCDAVVLNGLANVGADLAEVEILTADGRWTGPYRGAKAEIAARIVERIEGWKVGKL
ncbi:MAG: phosphopantothenoylcysteine decarboxylase [Phycisphaerales bacterium]|nr:MAG: phosphopantothenoylcysteine decarboxylase [Phycisphaerales bacterium]